MNLLGVGGHVGEGSGVFLGGGEVDGVGDGLVGRGAAHHPQHQLQVRHLGQQLQHHPLESRLDEEHFRYSEFQTKRASTPHMC